MKVLIVGAGASGLVAAINYKRNHPSDDVLIIEQLDKPLKKLLATGNGKCNLGNANIDVNLYSNSEFVRKIIRDYDYKKLFDSISIETKLVGDLAYPLSETAASVRNALLNEAEKLGISINVNEKLIDYSVKSRIEITTSKSKCVVDRLYLAGSLLSGKNLGSDGSVLSILKKHGYCIKEPLPGLCPIHTKENTKILDGIRVKCLVKLLENNKEIYHENGEVLFKENGLSGIAVFNTSLFIARSNKKASKIVLDLLPNYSDENIKNYCKSHTFDGFLQGFLNPKIAQYLCNRFVNEKDVISNVKNLEFSFKDFYGFEFSQISVGGVDVSEVNDSLMSKREKGVYLIGELIDVDAPCGGYNLTWAFASALISSK